MLEFSIWHLMLAVYFLLLVFSLVQVDNRERLRKMLGAGFRRHQNVPASVLLVLLRIACFMVFWPLFVGVSIQSKFTAARLLKTKKIEYGEDDAWGEDKITEFVDGFAERHPNGLDLGDCRYLWEPLERAFDTIPLREKEIVFQQLSERGIGLTGAAKTNEGQPLVLAFNLVDQLTSPIVLSKGNEDLERQLYWLGDRRTSFRVPDDVWAFNTRSCTWQNLAGRMGFAKVKGGMVTNLHVTLMN
ncbi:hypothetical protein [Ruegeria arenilitoris]|uniref:hypothetical protein n=1 Tax=Ruegeria arenilitoris TaxID=1173585 RepID=UPI001C95627E|nr:hypothetical protein [Ruegeria arenilitoris]MBY6082055.1 hypothetical protein [Ruegeria arenilitoris]